MSPNLNRLSGILDQFLSSAQNFALVVLVAKGASPTGFGAFAVSLSVMLLAVGSVQAALGEPLLIHLPKFLRGGQRAAIRASLRLALMSSILMALGIFIVGFVFSDAIRSCLWAVAVVLPFLLLEDVARFGFFACGQASRALALDAAWTIAWGVILVLIPAKNPAQHILYYGLTPIPALFIMGIYTGRLARDDGATKRLWREIHLDAGSLTIEFLALTGVTQAFNLVVAGLVDLPSAGGLRTVNTLFGPVNTLTNALRAVLLPEASKHPARGTSASMRLAIGTSILAGVLTLAVIGGLLLVPSKFGVRFFGNSWLIAAPLLAPVGTQRFLAATQLGALNYLRGAGQVVRSARIRPITSILAYGTAVVVTAWYGLKAGLWTTAVGSACSTSWLWYATRSFHSTCIEAQASGSGRHA